MNRIRELRKELGITMKQLGAQVGVGESTISLYELGSHDPGCQTLCKIADVLNTTTDYLLERSDVPHPKASPKITTDERNLINTFRSLNTDGRHALLSTASIIAGNPDMQKSQLSERAIS